MNNSKLACEWSCEKVVKGFPKAYLWTFTLKGCATYHRVAACWNRFVSALKYEGKSFPCVRVFEPHPGGHGYHVHFVTGQWMDVNVMRCLSTRSGFGRIHVKAIPIASVVYIAKYLSKAKRQECAKGKRLWACCMFSGVKVREIRTESDFSNECRARYELLKKFSCCGWTDKRIRFAAFLSTCAFYAGGWSTMMMNGDKGNLTQGEREFLWANGAPLFVGVA